MKKFAIVLTAVAVVATGAFAQAKAKVGVSIYKFDDTFMSSVRSEIEKEAAAAGTQISVQDGQNDQSKQNDIVDLFLTQGYNSLALNMVEPASANVVIAKAAARKVPVVLFNREPGDLDLAKFPNVYYVGAKAQESGTMEGQIIADYWKKNTAKADKNKDGKLQYVMLIGDPSNTDAKYRTEFSIKAVKDAGIKVESLAEDTAMWNRGDAQNKMQAWLAKFGDKIEAVFANNDDMALGAIEALKAAGYFTGSKYMPVVGVDATDAGKDALKQGTLLGTVLNDAVNQGKATYDLAAQLGTGAKTLKTVAPLANKDGKPDPNGHYVWVPYQKVTK